MKCCASSTTSTAPSPPQADPRAFVEAQLFAAALKPVAESLGFMGEAVVSNVAQQLFTSPKTKPADG